MRQVALISQTLRARHCHAYMSNGGHEQLILTPDPSAFTDFEFAVPTRVVSVSPPPGLLPTTRLTGARIFRAALQRARSGSRMGAWLERAIKKVAWRIRLLDRLVPFRRRRRASRIDESAIRSSAMYLMLEEEHASNPLGRLVVFDVFDLPVALAFAENHHVEVLVR